MCVGWIIPDALIAALSIRILDLMRLAVTVALFISALGADLILRLGRREEDSKPWRPVMASKTQAALGC